MSTNLRYLFGCCSVALTIPMGVGACGGEPQNDDAVPERGVNTDARSREDSGSDDGTDEVDASDGAADDMDGESDLDIGDEVPEPSDAADTDPSDSPESDVSPELDDSADVIEDSELHDSSESSDSDAPEICASVTAIASMATRPVDIIWVVDNSLSMQEEVAQVNRGINSFSQFIVDSGIDYNVVMISGDDPVVGDGYYHVCVPPPLSGTAFGICPEGRDVDSAQYFHVRRVVDSQRLLSEVLAAHGVYASRLRAGAATHLIAVTDDRDDLVPATFLAEFRALAGVDSGARVHSIVGRYGDVRGGFDECGGPGCPCADDEGAEYEELSRLTSGTTASVCSADWSPIFGALGNEVVATSSVPCVFAIPESDGSYEIDPALINVLANTSDTSARIPNVAGASECGGEPGWYYDNPSEPTFVSLCDAACIGVTGSVTLEFGCDTVKR